MLVVFLIVLYFSLIVIVSRVTTIDTSFASLFPKKSFSVSLYCSFSISFWHLVSKSKAFQRFRAKWKYICRFECVQWSWKELNFSFFSRYSPSDKTLMLNDTNASLVVFRTLALRVFLAGGGLPLTSYSVYWKSKTVRL